MRHVDAGSQAERQREFPVLSEDAAPFGVRSVCSPFSEGGWDPIFSEERSNAPRPQASYPQSVKEFSAAVSTAILA